jgi:diaminopimelate decarboxylase
MEQINYQLLKSIEGAVGTPFYLMNEDQYIANIRSFISAFKTRYPSIIA